MGYLGGKQRIAQKIVAYLNQFSPTLDFYEPFVGGFNIRPHFKRHFASDLHLDLILLYQTLQDGSIELPNCVDEKLYNEYKYHSPSSALRGFIGFGCSFSGKWFGGYARNSTGRNYAKNAKNSLLKKFKNTENVVFECKDYKEISADRAVIYCDPPYKNTTKYSISFNHGEFWEWVRKTSSNNIVIVSEYTAPDDFSCVLEIPTRTDMRNKSNNNSRVEKLFRYDNKSLDIPTIL